MRQKKGNMEARFPTQKRKRGESEKDKKEDEGFFAKPHGEKSPGLHLWQWWRIKNCFSPLFLKENPSSGIIDISYSFWSWTVQSMNVDMNNSLTEPDSRGLSARRTFPSLQKGHEKCVFAGQDVSQQGSLSYVLYALRWHWHRAATNDCFQQLLPWFDSSFEP